MVDDILTVLCNELSDNESKILREAFLNNAFVHGLINCAASCDDVSDSMSLIAAHALLRYYCTHDEYMHVKGVKHGSADAMDATPRPTGSPRHRR